MAIKNFPQGAPVLVGINNLPGHIWCGSGHDARVFVTYAGAVRIWRMHTDSLKRVQGPLLPSATLRRTFLEADARMQAGDR